MQFEFTEEQRMIRDMAAAFSRDRGASEAVRAAVDGTSGFDHETWRQMSQELGFAGLMLPEALEGQALGLVEAAIVFEEMGRVLLPSPLLGTVMSASAIEGAADDSQAQRWLPGVARGDTRAALGVCSNGGAEGSAGVDASFAERSDGAVLDGVYRFVSEATSADVLVLAGRIGGDVKLAVVPADREGIRVERHTSLDITRPHHTVHAEGVRVQPDEILSGASAESLDAAIERGCILLAAEQAGAAAETLARTVTYSGEREQFGRAIGSFQALKHRMADMMIQVEAAISAVYFAACSADEDPATLPQMASLAKVQASETLQFCAASMIQLHGGIGFTWEHDAHLYFKRARASAGLFGSVAAHEERLAVFMGLDEEVAV